MEHKKYTLVNKFVAIFMVFLMLPLSFGVGSVRAEEAGGSAANTENVATDAEVEAFKLGTVFSVVAGLLVAALYFPAREANRAVNYYGERNIKYRNFIKSFPNAVLEDKQQDSFKQEGCLWDWAACFSYVISSRNGNATKQKDIVKKLFGECAFFEHNRKESLPINSFYSSRFLESVAKLGDENGMVFNRELVELGMKPDCDAIENRIMNFYKSNGNKPFVISDSYFYNGDPFVHFVVISKIEEGTVTVKDPAVGLSRVQPFDRFCAAYIHENGLSKLPSVDMFTFKEKQ